MIENTIASIVASAGTTTLCAAALIWLSKTWVSERIKGAIQLEYDQKLEAHKAQLRAEHEVSLERLRAELVTVTKEHEVRFTHLHGKVAIVVATVFEKLQALFNAVSLYVTPNQIALPPDSTERRNAVNKAAQSFTSYFRPHRIYLPRDVTDKIEAFYGRLWEIADRFAMGVDDPQADPAQRIHEWSAAFKELRKEGRPIFDDLCTRFQELLGVPPAPAPRPEQEAPQH